MGFRHSDLQPAFEGPGAHPFRICAYDTPDPLEEVLALGYMRSGGSSLSPGDLIYVRSGARSDGSSRREVGARRSGATTGGRPWEPAVRVALLMVVGWERNAMRLRLVQDYGRPEDGALPVRASEARPAVPAPAVARPAAAEAPPAAAEPGLPQDRAEPLIPVPAVSAPAVSTPAPSQALAELPAPAPVAPAKRGRGRPPGSGKRKAVLRGFAAGFR